MDWPTRVFEVLAEQEAEHKAFLATHGDILEQWAAAVRPRPPEAD